MHGGFGLKRVLSDTVILAPPALQYKPADQPRPHRETG